MFCLSIYCFPKNASCQFTTKTQWHQPDVGPQPPKTQKVSIYCSGVEGQQGEYTNPPTPQTVSGTLGDREQGYERDQTEPPHELR